MSATYQYSEAILCVNDVELKILEVTNFDELFDEIVNNQSHTTDNLEDSIPYWTELWPSSRGLSEYLAEHKDCIINKKIIEIGCGLGLPSLLSLKLGAKEVLATDLSPEALEHVILNTNLNLLSKGLQTQIFDWTMLNTTQYIPYDIILAADIIYEKRFVDSFIKLVNLLIQSGQKKTILIAEPNRNVALDMLDKIISLSKVAVSTTLYDVVSRGINFKINVHKLDIGS